MATGITWRVPPEVLQKALVQYGERAKTAVSAVATQHAAKGQNDMRNGARWTDRTGNARNGLIGVAVKEGDKIAIYFIHSMNYGVHLELARGGRYKIIYPTTLAQGNAVMKSLQALFS